ncbi:hypothetical protein [Streptomyces zagrosensis]|uniref:Uncharacterized protein n=1 Tax=Streptomyces zagrosensis TaxID=1042984 RepID=A0A7W9UVY2_9ACTN|nr:hypothetical protein [Streptomyces zagrosensis]MBB5933315.1 hypothetical protein [Streptomyces zagrosensis]
MKARQRSAPRTQRRGTPWGARLLLFTALLFGVVTMHTLGHPTGHGTPAGHTAPVQTQQTQQTQSAAARHLDHPTAAGAGASVHHTAHAERPAAPHTAAAPLAAPLHLTDPAHGGMDPMSVCLAVLGVWTIALLLSAAARRRASASAAERLTALAHALRPDPPPRLASLARRTVLRM